jgi:hypothetical protein
LREYIRRVAQHWKGLAIGLGATVLVAVADNFGLWDAALTFGNQQLYLWPLVLVLSLFWAQYRVFHDVRQERDDSREQLSGLDEKREVRERLAALGREADLIVGAPENALSMQEAADVSGDPQPIVDWSCFDQELVWLSRVRQYLRESPRLGEEFEHRFDAHSGLPIFRGRPIVSKRASVTIDAIRERQRRLDEFRRELS